ncbi:carboxylesterase family protein [Chryseobacterium populi]|nr:PHB depolymerase family esterase [Chryseobacterium populi]
MNRYLKIVIIFSFILTLSNYLNAQNKSSDHLKADSLTFFETRAALNQIPATDFQKLIYKHNEKELPYRLLLPRKYNAAEKYPVVITFHNSTRIGNDNEKQLEPLSKIWLREEIYSQYHCFVIAPQFNERSSNYFKNKNGVLESRPGDDVRLVLELLKGIENQYNIDPSRIYLVGYSMGASTAQNLMALAPQKFAAMISIAAVPDFSNLSAWKNKSILLIHGQNDTENPYIGSVELYSKLSGNKKLTFKTYTQLDHNNITIPFLLSDEIPKWLFKQHQ